MAIVKLLSDFDGVWTNQDIEADYVWKYIINCLSNLTGETPDVMDKLLADCLMITAGSTGVLFQRTTRKTRLAITTRYLITLTEQLRQKHFQTISSSFITLKTAYSTKIKLLWLSFPMSAS
jgi:hypothetical protein